MSKYQPLQKYFKTLLSTTNEVTLKFADIGAILGESLPRSAFEWIHFS
jgi:hypothetical protein